MAALLLTAVVVLVWRAVESRPFQHFTSRQLVQVVRLQTGLELSVGSLRWRLVPLRIETRDVEVSGPGVRAQVARLDIDVGRFLVTRSALVLDTVVIRSVDLAVDGAPEVLPGGGGREPVRIVVRRLDLRDARFQGRSLPGQIDAEVSGFQMAWFLDDDSLAGSARARQVRLEIPGVRPVDLEASGTFRWRDGLELRSLYLKGTGLDLAGRGEVDLHRGAARLSARVDVNLAELDRVARIGGVLRGDATLDLEFDSERAEPVRATVRSNRLEVEGLEVTDLGGTVILGADGLRGLVERGRFLGGDLQGEYRLDRLGPPFGHRVEASCRGLRLERFLRALGAPSAGLSSVADAEVEVAWNGRSFPSGSGLATAVLAAGPGPLPVSGRLDVQLTAPGWLQFDSSDLQIGDSTARIQGPLELGTWQPAWSIRADPARVGDLIALVNGFAGDEVLPPDLEGRGVVEVTLAGAFDDLTVDFRLDAEDLALPPLKVDRGVVAGTVSSGRLEVQRTRFRLGGGGGDVTGTVAWGGRPEAEFDLRIEGRNLPLRRVGAWLELPGAAVPRGAASFTGGLRGPARDLRGSWALGLSDVTVFGTSLGSGAATVDLADGGFTARGLAFDSGLQGRVAWHVGHERVTATLGWDRMSLPWLPPAASAMLGERADWSVDVVWELGGPPTGVAVVNTDLAQVSLNLDRAAGRLWAEVAGVGRVDLDLDGAGGMWTGGGRLAVDSLGGLLARLAPGAPVPLTGRLDADLNVTLGPRGPEVRAQVPSMDVRLESQPIRLLDAASVALGPDGLEVGDVRLDIGGDELEVQGSIAPDGQVSGWASGAVNAVLLRFVAPGWEPAGLVRGQMVFGGSVDRPRINGITRIEDGSFRLPGTRSVISAVNGEALLMGDELAIENTAFRFMRGDGRCRGTITLAGRPQLDLAGTVERLEYPLFPDFTPVMSGTWALRGPVDEVLLAGDLAVDRGEVRRKDDLATLLVAWFGDIEEDQSSGAGMRLDLQVTADETLVSRTPFLRLQGSADLRVTGTSEQPGLVGSLEFEEGGEFTLQGIRYELERGQITFSDPTGIDPFVDLHARATIREYEVWARMTGTLDRLVPSVSSDPPLSESEIYALMSLGQVGDGRAGGVLGLSVASSMLTRGLNEALESRDEWLLPVDQIRVDPRIESSTGNPSARVTVVKQLSPTLTVTLESDLTGEREEVLTGRWYLGKGLYVEAIRDGDGSYGLDIKWRQRY